MFITPPTKTHVGHCMILLSYLIIIILFLYIVGDFIWHWSKILWKLYTDCPKIPQQPFRCFVKTNNLWSKTTELKNIFAYMETLILLTLGIHHKTYCLLEKHVYTEAGFWEFDFFENVEKYTPDVIAVMTLYQNNKISKDENYIYFKQPTIVKKILIGDKECKIENGNCHTINPNEVIFFNNHTSNSCIIHTSESSAILYMCMRCDVG